MMWILFKNCVINKIKILSWKIEKVVFLNPDSYRNHVLFVMHFSDHTLARPLLKSEVHLPHLGEQSKRKLFRIRDLFHFSHSFPGELFPLPKIAQRRIMGYSSNLKPNLFWLIDVYNEPVSILLFLVSISMIFS